MIQCVVCIRPFSDSVPVQADQKEGKMTALSAPGAMNPDDKAAVEAALRLREAGQRCHFQTLPSPGRRPAL